MKKKLFKLKNGIKKKNMSLQSNTSKELKYNFDLFFTISADLICIAGYDGYFKKVNPAVSLLLGYSEEELYAKPINSFVYPPDLKKTIETREQVYQNKPLLYFENRYVTKTAEIVWLSWTSMPASEEKLVYGIAKNITYQKRIEEERNNNIKNLTKINKELKDFSYTTSHDLKSSVNNLLMIFELIDSSLITDKETLDLMNILKSTTETISQKIQSSVNKLTMEKQVAISIEDLPLNTNLEEVLKSIKYLIANSQVKISTDFSLLPKIRFNKEYLKSIFLNLITNSIKYAKPNTFASVSITSQRKDGKNQLIYSDNGLGFDMDKVQDKIFGLHQKFHQHIDSSGVGLYLIYNHITNLGGTIDVQSAVNEGTTFTITMDN